MKIFPLTLIPSNTQFDFMRVRWVGLIAALLMLVVALGGIAVKGFNFGLDFTGGTAIELGFEKAPNIEQLRGKLAAAGFENAQVQAFGNGTDVLVRLRAEQGQGDKLGNSVEQSNLIVTAVTTQENPVVLKSRETISALVSSELTSKALQAVLFVLVGFLIYISLRFEWKFAVVASITTLFDVVVAAGFFALTGREFDLTVLAGLLSVMGFSINDTIVVFDRVRENFRTMRGTPFEVFNASINQTLSRTIITSAVFFLSVLALFLFGGESLQGLALTQMIGAIVGTASSIFVACAMLTVGPLTVTKQDLMPKARDDAELDRRP
ncbi:protein translocase subunit SecF [Lysobacteraceae bacterium NML120232]|nr:protein translocase subunit SecF [Xanthomonadaceae bacterium NML08-0793]PJK12229.1 protein translocase subunit SecF [Xanthomonadaceae bacterium NML120232]